MLLLFIFAIGGRGVVAMGVCHCVESVVNKEHHSCCSCEEHADECENHEQSVDSACSFVGVDLFELGTIPTDSKSSISKRVLWLSLLVEMVSFDEGERIAHLDYRDHNSTTRYLDWICDIGLLRAPPVC